MIVCSMSLPSPNKDYLVDDRLQSSAYVSELKKEKWLFGNICVNVSSFWVHMDFKHCDGSC